MPSVRSIDWSSAASRVSRPAAGARQRAQVARPPAVPRCTAGVPLLGRLAERLERRDRRVANGPSSLDHPVDVRRDRAEVGQHGRRLVAERAEPRHRRLQLAQERRQPLDVRLQVAAPLGRRLGDLARLLDRRADAAALARQRRQHRVRVAGQVGQHRFWSARIFRTASTSFSAGSARRMTSERSSPRPATPMPRSDRMIESRSRDRLAHDVVDEVEVDRLAVALDRQQQLALARALPRSRRARRRLGSPAARGCVTRTPRSARRSATAGGRCTRRPRGSPGSPRR